MRLKAFFLFFALISLSSCGPQKNHLANFSVGPSKVIVGDELPDWDIVDRETELNLSYTRPVGKLIIGDHRCTGFLIGPKAIMTNHHCISGQFEAEKTIFTLQKWDFDYSGQPYLRKSSYSCPKFILANKELDFAIVECHEALGDEYGHLELSSGEDTAYMDVHIVHHNCDYIRGRNCSPRKLISEGEVLPNVEYNRFFHTGDTLSGSSGAPVISTITGKVIGLHNSGLSTMSESRPGMGMYNGAIKINKIVQYIKSEKPLYKWSSRQ